MIEGYRVPNTRTNMIIDLIYGKEKTLTLFYIVQMSKLLVEISDGIIADLFMLKADTVWIGRSVIIGS